LYLARTGCQWRVLPKDFPPFTTVEDYFYDWGGVDREQSVGLHHLCAAAHQAISLTLT
jgi:transposase